MDFPYINYIRFTEDVELKVLDLVFSYFKKSFYFNPLELYTNTVTYILKQIDTSDSCNILSPLPLEYLKLKYQHSNLQNKKFTNSYNEKKYYLSLIKEEDKKSIFEDTYLDVPIKNLFKNVLDCEIEDNFQINDLYINDDLENDENIVKKNYYNFANRNAWLSNLEINEIFDRIIYFNIPEIKATYFNCLYLTNEKYSEKDIYNFHISILKEKYNSIINSKKNKIIFIPIIFEAHFVLITINLTLRICYFFDSAGYNSKKIQKPTNVNKTKKNSINYFFLQGNMQFVNHDNDGVFKSDSRYNYIRPFTNMINEVTNIKKFAFNEYVQQQSKIECGTFIITFAILSMYILPINKMEIKNIYNALIMKGGDYTVSFVRSLFFVTEADILKYFDTTKEYYNNIFTINISNEKYKQQLEIHQKVTRAFDYILNNTLKNVNTQYISTNIINNHKKLQNYFDKHHSQNLCF